MDTLVFRWLAIGGVAAVLLLVAIPLRHSLQEFHEFVRRTPTLGRAAFAILLAIFVVYGGSKTNQTDGVGGLVGGALRAPRNDVAFSVTSEDIARGWRLWEVRTNANVCYAMPEGAAMATNWWVRGAYEDVVRMDGLWAFSWGKLRFALTNEFREITAVGAPMSAVPYGSRLWSAADTNGSHLVTWENFALNRDTNTPVNAQVEFLANGDFLARSNELETVYHLVDDFDWDGDGIENGGDPRPLSFDGDHTGQSISNRVAVDAAVGTGLENGYYKLTVALPSGRRRTLLTVGDEKIVAAEPGEYSFLLRKGEVYSLDITPFDPAVTFEAVDDIPASRLLLGGGFTFSDWSVDGDSLELVVPTAEQAGRCCWMPRFQVTPPVGHLGVGSLSATFTAELRDYPEDLPVSYHWSSDDYYVYIEDPDEQETEIDFAGWLVDYSSTVSATATFGTNILVSSCWCCHESPTIGLSLDVPPGVFRNGALRHMSASFSSDAGVPLEGSVHLECTSGAGRINLWADANKSAEVDTYQIFDAATFSRFECYVEGVETSGSCDDITFALTYCSPDGDLVTSTASLTCMEVEAVQILSEKEGCSSNPPPFVGQMPHEFNVTHSPHPDQHAVVFFKDVLNPNDFSVNDFTVSMILQVAPANAPTGSASWFAFDSTPESGSLVPVSKIACELRNPKVGGVYHIGAVFDGSPTNECNIVLPLAGAEMSEVLRGDLAEADGFVERSREDWPRRWYTRALFAAKWFTLEEYGYYRGRPDNSNNPTVWPYNQVRKDGKGAVGTLLGLPIHIEKLSNLLAAYACAKLDVPLEEQGFAQRFGHKNDESAELSWIIGIRLAYSNAFEREVGYLTTNAYRWASEKSEKLWPNNAPVDNHRGSFGYGDFDTEFSSPGFIYCEQ